VLNELELEVMIALRWKISLDCLQRGLDQEDMPKGPSMATMIGLWERKYINFNDERTWITPQGYIELEKYYQI
jgi:hypothetical protein